MQLYVCGILKKRGRKTSARDEDSVASLCPTTSWPAGGQVCSPPSDFAQQATSGFYILNGWERKEKE